MADWTKADQAEWDAITAEIAALDDKITEQIDAGVNPPVLSPEDARRLSDLSSQYRNFCRRFDQWMLNAAGRACG